MTIGNGQRITGSAQAPLGLASGGPNTFSYGLCYQSTAAGAPLVNPFAGSNYSIAEVSTTRIPFAASETKSGLAAGTYNVGFCVNATTTFGTFTFDDNDYVNGWVMVTND